MSSKNNREQELLLFLSETSDYITAEMISKELDISTKTVYRLVKKINGGFEEGILIQSEKGRGYKLQYENFIKAQKNGMKTSHKDVSPKDRQRRIAEKLLLLSPKWIKVHELYDGYYVGDTSIFNDEQLIAMDLKKYNVSLQRKNRSLRVLGRESDIRQAIREISDVFNIIDIDELKNNDNLDFNKYDVLFVTEQLRIIEKTLGATMPYPYNVNIFSHLYILIDRAKRHVLLEEDIKSEIESLDNTMYKLALLIIDNIKNYLDMNLPEVEIYYMYQYLVSSRVRDIEIEDSQFNEEVFDITNYYINRMESLLNINIENNIIFNDLANHIKPMLNRLQHKIKIKNSLLYQINKNYKDIFDCIRIVSNEVSQKYNLPIINDNENSFLTLYFARIIEIYKQTKTLNVLIVCTTGIGTSELLKVKIERLFPEINVKGVLSSKQLLSSNINDIDLIISTIDLEKISKDSYILVSALFNKDDQKRLSKKVEELYHAK